MHDREESGTKRFLKTIVLLLCILAVTGLSCACILHQKTPLPETREALVEPVPEPNALREYEEVNGIGGSRFFIQSPKADALQTVSVAQFGASPDSPDNADLHCTSLDADAVHISDSDGCFLIENCDFSRQGDDDININNGVWHEGTGADNILVRNNKFIECSVIGTEIIEVGTHLLDKSNHSYAFTNIRIENNEFRDVCGNLMVVNNVNNFVFRNNTVTLGDAFRKDLGKGRCYFLADCVNVDISGNDYTDSAKLPLTRIARSNSPIVWLRVIVLNVCLFFITI